MLTLSLLMIGCTQNAVSEIEVPIEVKNDTFSVLDGRVVFKDFNSYANFVQKTEQVFIIGAVQQLVNKADYQDPFDSIFKRQASKEQLSRAQTYNEDNELPSNSELLLSFLNDKAILQVGDKVIRYTKHYDFSTNVEYVDKLQDDTYLANLINEDVTSNKSTNYSVKGVSDVQIHPIVYSTTDDCAVDFIDDGSGLTDPCEDISNGPNPPTPPPGPVIVTNYSTSPIDHGRYVRYLEDRRAQLHVIFRGSKLRLEVKPIINPHTESVRTPFVDWISNDADLLYAGLYDVKLKQSVTKYGGGVTITPNYNYIGFNDDLTQNADANTSEFIPSSWLWVPLDPRYYHTTISIKTVNYIEQARGGNIYKVKRIVQNNERVTLDD
jgi:hypothetical protein